MGRRLRGAALRAAKRIKVADDEIVDNKAAKVETDDLVAKKDEDLFIIDTTAVLPSKKQIVKREKKVKHPRRNQSLKEQAQIEKLIKMHSSDRLQQLVKSGNMTSKTAKRKASVHPTFDLWEEEPNLKDESPTIVNVPKPVIGSALAGTKPSSHVQIATRPAMPPPSKSKALTIEVAKAGQSYNPDKFLHTKVLHEAVQVEEKRQHAEKESKAPVATGMSEETRKYLVGSDSEDSEDEVGDEGDDKGEQSAEKIQKKLTRAERNKQKRVRAEERVIENRKRQKRLQNSVAEAKTIAKQLSKQEQEQMKRREEMEQLKAAKERTKGVNVYMRLAEENPINAPTYPVALSSELSSTGGSLRSIRPKGSLITDRMTSFADRDMTAKKQLKQRTRVEGKRRKIKLKVRGKGHAESKEGEILG